MKHPEWEVVRIHVVEGGWSWEIAHHGLVVLVAAEPIRNPATCTLAALRLRNGLAAGRFVLDDTGHVIAAG